MKKQLSTIFWLFIAISSFSQFNPITEIRYNGMIGMSQKITYSKSHLRLESGISADIHLKKGMFLSTPIFAGFNHSPHKDVTMFFLGGYSAMIPTNKGFTEHSYMVKTGVKYKSFGLCFDFLKMQYITRPFIGVTIQVYGKGINKR